MWTRSIASKALRTFADERRRIISSWRLLIVCRRIASAENAPLPGEQKTAQVVRHLLAQRQIARVDSVPEVYRIDSPFADVIPIADEQVVQEANPCAVFSHLTALVHQGLTDQIPRSIQITEYELQSTSRHPLGTTPEDWVELDLPAGRRPRQVGDVDVQWLRAKAERDFGHTVRYVHGLPIYVTDVERTLLDAIRAPDKAGGISNVLRAWREASPNLNVDTLVQYTERFGSPVMKQRVGFLLETLGHGHTRLEQWRASLQRGGSLKLVAREPYAATFSERWNLSLNVPSSVIALLTD
jgi:predicted transcriptional regulator of viral defense system